MRPDETAPRLTFAVVLACAAAGVGAGCHQGQPAGSGDLADAGSPETRPSAGGTGGDPGAAGGSGGANGSVQGTGNPDGHCAIPAAAAAVPVSNPTTRIGDGTPRGCTGDAVVAAVHAGGIVTFDCGPAPLTIAVPEIDIFNDGGQGDGSVTLDGGGKITLTPDGNHRILYQNTCDSKLHFTSPRCDVQTTPHLVVQNLSFVGGQATADPSSVNGGGAIYVGGGTFKAVNISISNSSEVTLGPDFAGGGLYAFEQAEPVYLVASSFEGNSGSNGGALGGLFASFTILNSLFRGNQAIGHGENPARPGTTGGGLGGAIYNDGNDYTLTVCGTRFDDNQANELGSGAIFQVVNDLNGDLLIDQSTFHGNSNGGAVQSHPGIYVEARDKPGNAGVTITNSTFD